MPAASQKKRPSRDHETLVDHLARALRERASRGQPTVFENRIGQTDALNVFVIWDRWGEIRRDERSKIIIDAYKRIDEGKSERVAIATGATLDEAIAMGVLPYWIAITRKRDDPASPEQLREAMIDEGAVETVSGLQLRFNSLEEAKEAYSRLTAKVPGPYWAIVHEVSRGD
jgi:hypothetical protein